MAEILITRDDCGKLVGLDETDHRAFTKFMAKIRALVPGECVRLAFWIPRSPKLHRFHFLTLSRVFDAQEQFADREQFRMWAQVGAGHCDFVPGPQGRMVALPRSIAYHRMDDAAFAEHHQSVIDFFRSPQCTAYLWGHLSAVDQAEMMSSILGELNV